MKDEKYIELLSKNADGGGCAETWEFTEEFRENNTPTRNHTSHRRTFMGRAVGLIGVIATGIGISDSVSAFTGKIRGNGKSADAYPDELRENGKQLAEKYRDLPTTLNAIEDYASDLLTNLHKEGYLEGDSVSALGITSILDTDEYVNSDEGMTTHALFIGKPTGNILIRRKVNKGKLVIIVRPEKDEAFASITSTDGETREIFESSNNHNTNDSPILMSHLPCYTGNECLLLCSTTCTCGNYEITCCEEDKSCTIGDYVGGVCDLCANGCYEACGFQ